MPEPIDYCSRCSSSCCDPLLGLKVTREEFASTFSGREDKLVVSDLGAFLEVTAKDSRCPNFIDRKCAVYETRPAECRLYPYSIYAVLEEGEKVRAYAHGGTETCPFKWQLLPSEAEVRALIDRFLAAAFPGRGREITIELNPDFRVLRLRRLRARIENGARRIARRVWPGRAPRRAGTAG